MIILRGVNVFPTQIEEALVATPGLPRISRSNSRAPTGWIRCACCVKADERHYRCRAAIKALSAQIKQTVGISVTVEVMDVGGVARSEGKAVRILDNRPKG